MTDRLDRIHKDITDLKKDVEFIKHVLREEFELSDYAKKKLKRARATSKSKYVNIDEID